MEVISDIFRDLEFFVLNGVEVVNGVDLKEINEFTESKEAMSQFTKQKLENRWRIWMSMKRMSTGILVDWL